jgi:hypothetical protein
LELFFSEHSTMARSQVYDTCAVDHGKVTEAEEELPSRPSWGSDVWKEEQNMDPKETIKLATEASVAGRFDQVKEHCDNYLAWRLRGGFEPPGGDAAVKALVMLNRVT